MRAETSPAPQAAHPRSAARGAAKPFFPSVWIALALLGAILPTQTHAADPYPGYTLFSTGSTAYLYNMKKEKVHEWKVAAGTVQTSTYLLPDGSMLFPLNRGGTTFRAAGAHGSGTFTTVASP